jgi:hypothetical protein
MIVNIIFIILIISYLFVYIYVYAVPWFKGTMVPANNPNCAGTEIGECESNSWCCKTPEQDDQDGYCLSKKCSDIRLATPSDRSVNFFRIYTICVIIFMIILIFIKWKYKK